MRPPFGGRSVPILHNRKQKEERAEVISRQIRALEESKEKLRQLKKERVGETESGRTDKLRIIEDIQLVKPREDGGNVRRKEDPSGTSFLLTFPSSFRNEDPSTNSCNECE